MTDKKKLGVCKPPVPPRPKNLVVLNSKHLPKPPETFSSENVSNIIKDLNLDEENERGLKKQKETGEKFENSDSEEDTYGYLEPVSMTCLKSTEGNNSVGNNGVQSQIKKSGSEENFKFGDILRKVMNRNGAPSSEIPESDDFKSQISQSQWQRPLPSLPVPTVETKTHVAAMPWYKNVDRKKGEEILRNGVDGYFLVRPSSNAETYLTLTLWHNGRVYNIPIRKRKDGKFALGTPKTHEQCFDSVEFLVKNYQSEKLVLYSNGVQTGKTLLTTYPP